MGRFDHISLNVNEKRMIIHHYKSVKETLLELQEESINNLDFTAFEKVIESIDNKIETLKEN